MDFTINESYTNIVYIMAWLCALGINNIMEYVMSCSVLLDSIPANVAILIWRKACSITLYVCRKLVLFVSWFNLYCCIFIGHRNPPLHRNVSLTSLSTWHLRYSNTQSEDCTRPTRTPSPYCWLWRSTWPAEKLNMKNSWHWLKV